MSAVAVNKVVIITLLPLVCVVSGDAKLCSMDAALYTLTVTPEGLSQVVTSVQREINPDVFCIQSANCKCNTTLHKHNCASSILIMILWTLPNIVTAACFIQKEAAWVGTISRIKFIPAHYF